MKGGSYEKIGDQLHRLDRESGEWLPCDANGEYLVSEQAPTPEVQPEDLEEGE